MADRRQNLDCMKAILSEGLSESCRLAAIADEEEPNVVFRGKTRR